MTLADDKKDSFDHGKFEAAAKHLHSKGAFSPDMMSDAPVRGLTAETFRVLSSAIPQDVPVELRTYLQENTFIFSGFKTYHELKEASVLLQDDKGGFKSFEVFKRDITGIDNTYNRNYLNAEYKFAVQSSQMAVKWQDFEKDGDRYLLQYRTASDDKVRPEHAVLNGTTLPIDDPFWNSYLPPLDWGCRCTTVQVSRNKYPMSNSQEACAAGERATALPKQKIFRFNPGKDKVVFPPKHPYLPKGCGKCNTSMHLAWGLGKPECAVCLMIRQMAPLETITPQSDKPVFRRMQKNAIKAYGEDIIQEQGKQFYTSRLVCSKDDFDRVIGHCYTAREIEAVRKLPTLFSSVSNGKYEPLHIDRPNIRKKIEKGAIHFVYYKIKIDGALYELQTIAIKNKNERHGFVIEHPYSLKKKESE